ncbi:type VI secretion system-associated FHA domain protein [Nitrincola nitratireducens]|uniref:FHA domain-containing protein n=3 Tax=Nitrincola TaxID=267849 RepID=W9VK62_9GAMM|nr:FHA domain-containing protein [Nitrincola nitratireducens]EXJ10940.1 hypothetical protein D791_02038 [Nitrincola nitratireducens]
MRMELSVVSKQQAELQSKSSVFIEAEPLSIGRAIDNHWVLPDENLYLSGKHCIINRKNNRFIISDLSTNGVYLNHSEKPIGRGRCAVLNNGTLIRIGDYTIRASIDESTVRKADSLTNPLCDSAPGSALSEMLVDQTPVEGAMKTSSSFAADHISPEHVSLTRSTSYSAIESPVLLPENWLEEPSVEDSFDETPVEQEIDLEKLSVEQPVLEAPVEQPQEFVHQRLQTPEQENPVVDMSPIQQPLIEEWESEQSDETIEDMGANHSEG